MWYNDRSVWHNILTYPNWFLCRIHFQCMSTYRDFFFLIRLSFVYRSSPIIQVQNLPARPQTTIKNRKDEQGGRSTFGRLNLKTDEKKRKKKTGWTELLETGRSAVMRMRVIDPCDTVSESDVWEPNAVIKFSHVKRTF